MRVLQLITSLATGGAERIVANLTHQLRRSGHLVAVVSLFDPSGSAIEAELCANGTALYFLGKRPGLDVRMIPRIAAVIARYRPHVLHTHMQVLKYALPALAVGPCRVVHTVHNLAQYEVERPSRVVQYLAFRLGVVPVAIGEGVAQSVREVYGMLPRRIIPNGIRVSHYAPDPSARDHLRRALSIPVGAPTFLTVGRLTPQKNQAAIVRSIASARLRALGAHLVIAGDGELAAALRQQAHDLDVADRVHLLGVRHDVPRLLAAADVFVLSSRWEGNPLSVMEAMASGLPCVATAVGCVPELVCESTGVLVPPENEEGLEEAMYRLARDLALVKSKGAAAARVARERFDESIMARAYERLYRELL